MENLVNLNDNSFLVVKKQGDSFKVGVQTPQASKFANENIDSRKQLSRYSQNANSQVGRTELHAVSSPIQLNYLEKLQQREDKSDQTGPPPASVIRKANDSINSSSYHHRTNKATTLEVI